VFDVTPAKKGPAPNAYTGRIWVEDQEYNIVRTKGTHDGSTFSHQFHSDVWRQNLRPGLWLPTYVYSEESDMKYGLVRKLRFKSQTRLWGYDVKFNMPQEELTRVLVDDPNAVRDHSEAAQDLGPVQSQRAWEVEAQENVLEKLEKAGLLAPKGEVDKVLETVVNNLLITNNIDIQPEIHCRVLLTAPLSLSPLVTLLCSAAACSMFCLMREALLWRSGTNSRISSLVTVWIRSTRSTIAPCSPMKRRFTVWALD